MTPDPWDTVDVVVARSRSGRAEFDAAVKETPTALRRDDGGRHDPPEHDSLTEADGNQSMMKERRSTLVGATEARTLLMGDLWHD